MGSQSFLYCLIFLTASPFITLTIHIFLSRVSGYLKLGWSAQSVAGISVLSGYLVLGIALWRLTTLNSAAWSENFLLYFYSFLVYGSLSYAYFHIFNLSETARRSKILYELRNNGPLTRKELELRYPPLSQIPIRLHRLLDIGELSLVNGYYKLKRPLLWLVAYLLRVWGKVIGFDFLIIRQQKSKSDFLSARAQQKGGCRETGHA